MPHPELLRVTPALSAAVCGLGLYGLINPVQASKLFGIPSAGPRETIYYRPMAGRNLATGIALGFFSYWRDERALGTVMLCGICAGISDTYTLLVEETETEGTWLHLMNTGIVAVVGSGLLGWW